MKNKLQTIIMFAAFGIILFDTAESFAQAAVGDETALYNQTVAKISKTDALFAERKTNFEKIAAAKSNDTTICQSLADWNLIFHDRVANLDFLIVMQRAGKFEILRSKAGDLIIGIRHDLKENQANFTRLAAAHQCRLSNKTSSGAENTFSSLLSDDFWAFKTPLDDSFDSLVPSLSVKGAEDLFVQGYFDLAAKKLDRVIKVNPNYADAYAARAMLVYEQNNSRSNTEKSILASAQPDAEKAIELDPHNALANWVLGEIDGEDELDNGKSQAVEQGNALLYANQAVAKYPNDAENYYIRSIMQDSSEAIADLTKAISLDPKFGRAYQKRGEIYSQKSQYYEALADLNRAIAIFPQSVSTYRERAEVYYHLGEIEKATADLRRALEFDPKNVQLAEFLKSYNEPVKDWEIVDRYKFYRLEFDKSNSVFDQKKKKYDETLAAQPAKTSVCAAFTELKTAFQNEKSAFEKLLFINNYLQIAKLKQAIADNKTMADYYRENSALFAQEAVNRGCN